MNADTRATAYQQEFKRLNKLVREREERPLDVRVRGGDRSPVEGSTPPPPPPPTGQPSMVEKMSTAAKRRQSSAAVGAMRTRRMKKAAVGAKAPADRKKKGIGEEEAEEEDWQDASNEQSPPSKKDEMSSALADKPTTSAADEHHPPVAVAAATKASAADTGGKQDIIAYIRANGARLGVSADGKILRTGEGGQPYKTSKIEDVLTYLLSAEKQRAFKQVPPGTKEFVERAKNDKFLTEHLFAAKQTGHGTMMMTNFNKKHKKNVERKFITFKPSLW